MATPAADINPNSRSRGTLDSSSVRKPATVVAAASATGRMTSAAAGSTSPAPRPERYARCTPYELVRASTRIGTTIVMIPIGMPVRLISPVDQTAALAATATTAMVTGRRPRATSSVRMTTPTANNPRMGGSRASAASRDWCSGIQPARVTS